MFLNRVDAGRQLAPLVRARQLGDPVVLGLTRGGVPVAAEIARTLGAPLDICVVRKLMTEYGSTIGAVAEGGGMYLDEPLISRIRMPVQDLERTLSRAVEDVNRLAVLLRDGPALRLATRNVVLVDDGLASAACVAAALRTLRRQSPRSIVLAVPIAAGNVLDSLRKDLDGAICASTEDMLAAVGAHYRDFAAVSDAEIVDLLSAAHRGATAARPSTTAA